MFSIADKSSLLSLLWFSVPSPPHPSICRFSSPLSIITELGHALLKFLCSTTYSSTSLLQTAHRHPKCTATYTELALDVTQDAFVSSSNISLSLSLQEHSQGICPVLQAFKRTHPYTHTEQESISPSCSPPTHTQMRDTALLIIIEKIAFLEGRSSFLILIYAHVLY